MKTGAAPMNLPRCSSVGVVEGLCRGMLEHRLALTDKYWPSMVDAHSSQLSASISDDNSEKSEMIEKLDRAVKEAEAIKTPLIIVIGSSHHSRDGLLEKYASYKKRSVLNVGLVYGQHLASSDEFTRRSCATEALEEICTELAGNGLLFMNNIEILFDQSLALNPMMVLKKISRNRTTIAVWPGDVKKSRLQYATPDHPEFQDHSTDGVILFNSSIGEHLDALQ